MSQPRHGSPADRGSADAYYGRSASPHRITADNQRVDASGMTASEIAEYQAGYDGEEDRKAYD